MFFDQICPHLPRVGLQKELKYAVFAINEFFLLNLIPVCFEFYSGNPPTKKQIEDLEGQCEGIPLKVCYVEHGRVSFFSFNEIELHVLP